MFARHSWHTDRKNLKTHLILCHAGIFSLACTSQAIARQLLEKGPTQQVGAIYQSATLGETQASS